MLYTRKGDDGSTSLFGCDQRISKSSAVAEALGTLDETNSFLGVCKADARDAGLALPDGTASAKLLHTAQQQLFVAQAELAGSAMAIDGRRVEELEHLIDAIAKQLPPIKTFFIPGGTRLSATLDAARTVVRRAERRVIQVAEEGTVKVSPGTKAYLNRLSSLLYALSRWANHAAGIREEAPDYQ